MFVGLPASLLQVCEDDTCIIFWEMYALWLWVQYWQSVLNVGYNRSGVCGYPRVLHGTSAAPLQALISSVWLCATALILKILRITLVWIFETV